MQTRAPLLTVPALLGLFVFAAPGCGLIRTTVEAPGRVASAALGTGDKAPKTDPTVLQARLRRYADLFAADIRDATAEFAELDGTPEGRLQALTWRLDYTSSLLRIMSGERPFAALFDTIIVVTYLHDLHEQRWLLEWGEADRPMIESLARMEEGIWAIAAEGLTEAQIGEMRSIVSTWSEGDPTNRVADLTKLPGFLDLAGPEQGGSGLVGELTSLMRIDPLSGLEPAVREVEQSRQLAERVFFYVQRLPELIAARVELLTMRAGQSESVQSALSSADRTSQAAASLAATADALPATLSTEREAALAQLSAELTAQRAGLIQDLETAREPLVELLEGTRSTAEAGRAMSEALTETLLALDTFVGRFTSDDEGERASAEETEEAEASAADEESGGGFDITEYGAAAEQIGIAARELGATIATLEQSLPQVQRVLDEAAARGERSIDHAFKRALQLVGAAIAGGALAVLLVRWITQRWRPADRRAPVG